MNHYQSAVMQLPVNLREAQHERRRLLENRSGVQPQRPAGWWSRAGKMKKTLPESADGCPEQDAIANNNNSLGDVTKTSGRAAGVQGFPVLNDDDDDDVFVGPQDDGSKHQQAAEFNGSDAGRHRYCSGALQYDHSHVHRLVEKCGVCNVVSRRVTGRRRQYVVDMFTTLVEMRWRYHIVIFLASFVACWLLFAAIYLAIVYVHGDLDDRAQSNDWVPCIHNVFDFTSAVLYSFETQTTIGYGSRVIDPVCRFGVFVAMLQIYIGTLINMLVTGLVFVKISRPKSRRQTVVFSRSAVVCRRDGNYLLLFRVGDMRVRSHFVSTSVRALLVRSKTTAEGEEIPLCQYPLALETETGHNDSYIFLVWPVTVVHRIDEASPLWNVSARRLNSEHFEIIVILEGIIESTGATTQVLTSYIPAEIRWGERLVPLIARREKDGRHSIDFGQFHDTVCVESMPACSAYDWQQQHDQLVVDGGTSSGTQDDRPVSFSSASPPPPSVATKSFSRSLSVPARLVATLSPSSARNKPPLHAMPAAAAVPSDDDQIGLQTVKPTRTMKDATIVSIHPRDPAVSGSSEIKEDAAESAISSPGSGTTTRPLDCSSVTVRFQEVDEQPNAAVDLGPQTQSSSVA